MLALSNATCEKEECLICLEDMQEPPSTLFKLFTKKVQPLKKLLCEHQFHAQCITRWLAKEATCPCCRNEVQRGSFLRELDFKNIEIRQEALVLAARLEHPSFVKNVYDKKIPPKFVKEAIITSLVAHNDTAFGTFLQLRVGSKIIQDAIRCYQKEQSEKFGQDAYFDFVESSWFEEADEGYERRVPDFD